MFGGSRDIDNVAKMWSFTLQNVTGCSALSNSMSFFILIWKRRSTRESNSEIHLPLCFGFASHSKVCDLIKAVDGSGNTRVLLWELNGTNSLGTQNRKCIDYAEVTNPCSQLRSKPPTFSLISREQVRETCPAVCLSLCQKHETNLS